MESPSDNSLSTLLAASLSAAGLALIIDAAQASDLLGCTKEQIETMAARGELPAKKYGRGWIFVTAQLLHHVAADCANNLRNPRPVRALQAATDTMQVETVPARGVDSEARSNDRPIGSQPAPALRATPPIEPSIRARKRGRPRQPVPVPAALSAS